MLRPEDCIPGTLVECIDASRFPQLVERRVYRIAEVKSGVDEATGHRCFAIRVEGFSPVRIPCGAGVRRYQWPGPACFRLLPDERLSIFRAMLAPAPQKERV